MKVVLFTFTFFFLLNLNIAKSQEKNEVIDYREFSSGKIENDISRLQISMNGVMSSIAIDGSTILVFGGHFRGNYFFAPKLALTAGYTNMIQINVNNSSIQGFDIGVKYTPFNQGYKMDIKTENVIINTIPKFSYYISPLFVRRSILVRVGEVNLFGLGLAGGVDWFAYDRYYIQMELSYHKLQSGLSGDVTTFNAMNATVGIGYNF